MDFKDLIRELRLSQGLTLEQVGDVVGVSKATVKRWESGEIANLRRDKIYKLAQALHTTPAYLMGWDIDPEPKPLTKEKPARVDELTPDERAILAAIRALPDAKRQALLALLGIE